MLDALLTVHAETSAVTVKELAAALGERTDEASVRAEILHAQKVFEREGWPVIDVTRRSVEETAAAVLKLFSDRQRARMSE